MSGRRALAIAALVVVPLAVLAIVLITVGGGDNDSTPRSAQSGTSGAEKPPPAPSSDSTSQSPPKQRGSNKEPSLSVLDKGSPPPKVAAKLAPASVGGRLNLDRLRGTPIVLNVWSTDCPPCRAEARVLQSEWERLGRRGVLFLGLNVNDSPAAARQFRSEFDVDYPTVEEQRAETARSLGATGVPETMFISRSGKIVGRVLGGVTLGEVELGVKAAQTDQPVPDQQGGARIPLR